MRDGRDGGQLAYGGLAGVAAQTVEGSRARRRPGGRAQSGGTEAQSRSHCEGRGWAGERKGIDGGVGGINKWRESWRESCENFEGAAASPPAPRAPIASAVGKARPCALALRRLGPSLARGSDISGRACTSLVIAITHVRLSRTRRLEK